MLARFDCPQRRQQTESAHQRRDDEIRRGRGGHGDEPLGTAENITAVLGHRLPQRRAGGHVRHTFGEVLEDVVMLLVVILLVPLAILLVGMPVVLLVRLLLEIAQRM